MTLAYPFGGWSPAAAAEAPARLSARHRFVSFTVPLGGMGEGTFSGKRK